jgi:hypothetical protein
MPNGRSGGFPIDTTDLNALVSQLADNALLGILAAAEGAPAPRLRPTVRDDVVRLIAECPQQRVAVEEQDHSAYIIHLSNEPVVWVCVQADSPLFAGLRQRHIQWHSDHPDQDGWIAF